MSNKAKAAKKQFIGFQVDDELMQKIKDYKAKKEKALGVELRLAQVLRSIIEKEV